MSARLLASIAREGAWAAPTPLLHPGPAGAEVLPTNLWAAPSRPASDEQPSLFVGNIGTCGKPSLVCFIADDSPSVTDGRGTDPLANRYREARAAFRALARACTCGQCLGAVLHFDLVGGTGVLPVRETRVGRRRRGGRLHPKLEEALSMPAKAFGTSVLGRSLEVGLRLLASHPDHEQTLIVASDFDLFDDDPARVIADLDDFARNQGSVHGVVLGRLVPDGVLAPPIRTHLIQRGSAPGSLARAIACGLAEHRHGAAIITDAPPVLTIPQHT